MIFLQVLNFNGSGLSKLKLLSTLVNLKKLIVSFNDLSTLQDLAGMVRFYTGFLFDFCYQNVCCRLRETTKRVYRIDFVTGTAQ